MLLYVNSNGKKSEGLVRRRKAEVSLYINGTYEIDDKNNCQINNNKCSSGNGICITTDDCTKSGGKHVSGLCPNDPAYIKC